MKRNLRIFVGLLAILGSAVYLECRIEGYIYALAHPLLAEPITRIFLVSKYGAVGDGKADDTCAVQEAIDAAYLDMQNAVASKGVSRVVLIGPGKYLLRYPIRLARGLTIDGGGATLQMKTNNSAMFQVEP